MSQTKLKYPMGRCCAGGENGEKHTPTCQYNRTAPATSPEPAMRQIGDVRRSLFLPYECDWNGLVRDVTAEVEQPGMWVDEREVLKVLSAKLKSIAVGIQFRHDLNEPASPGGEPAPDMNELALSVHVEAIRTLEKENADLRRQIDGWKDAAPELGLSGNLLCYEPTSPGGEPAIIRILQEELSYFERDDRDDYVYLARRADLERIAKRIAESVK